VTVVHNVALIALHRSTSRWLKKRFFKLSLHLT